MRPELTPLQADYFTREKVLEYVGPAGADISDPWTPQPLSRSMINPDYIVETGSDLSTVQSAINQAIRNDHTDRVFIGVTPNTYTGLVYIPKLPFPITLLGLGGSATDTVLNQNVDAEMTGGEYTSRFQADFENAPSAVAEIFDRISARDKITTFNASVCRVENDDFQLLNLTIQNTYNADRDHPESVTKNALGQYTTGQHQAVALQIAGADRVQVQDVRLKSFQDTLYLQCPMKGATVRSCFTNCDIEGDVDFIFGQTTAWFEECTLRSLGTRAKQAWVTAPSTDIRTRYGFVFNNCDFTHDGSDIMQAGQSSLGRQWFEAVCATPYGASPDTDYTCKVGSVSAFNPPNGTISLATLNSVGKCVILRSRIQKHINVEAPWQDWNGPNWNSRFRPVQYTAGDMLAFLSEWIVGQGISYADINLDMVFLAEYKNTRV